MLQTSIAHSSIAVAADKGRTALTLLAALGLAACSSDTRDRSAEEFVAEEFRDCIDCPLMTALPAGSFLMGTAENERLIDPRTGKPAKNDWPQHRVDIGYSLAIGKFEVTAAEFGAFVAATGHRPDGPCMEFSPPESFTIATSTDWSATGFPQTDRHPVVCVSYFDSVAYTRWLSSVTGKNYRLPSEAEWEFAARANTTTPYYWGNSATDACSFANVRSPGADSISERQANSDIKDGFPCDDGFAHSSPAGQFLPNAYGLHDMQGNAWEWVADCNHKNYEGAPTDGSAWLDERGCQFGVIRSGSFLNRVERSSATVRAGRPREGRATNMGFRVVRDDSEAQSAAPDGLQGAWGVTAGNTVGQGETGAELFDNNCAACHVRRDDFRGVYGKDQQTIEQTIRDGGNNIMSMPAFGEVLSEADITALATYVRAKNGWD